MMGALPLSDVGFVQSELSAQQKTKKKKKKKKKSSSSKKSSKKKKKSSKKKKKSSKKNPVYKVSESLEQVTAKYFKEEEISVKTKEPTVIVRTDNKIPQS